MTTPAERIGALDAALLRSGELVQLQRPAGSTNPGVLSATATCHAFVTPEGVGQGHVIISPTDLIAAGWPGNDPDTPLIGDPLIPIAHKDTILIAGYRRTIDNVHPKYIGEDLIRIDLFVSA